MSPSSRLDSPVLNFTPIGAPCHPGGYGMEQGFTSQTHTQLFNGSFSGATRVSRYQKGKTNLDFTEARDSEWQWHQLGHMQVCTSLQTDNHASTPPLSFLQAGCPSCCPTNSVKALKAIALKAMVLTGWPKKAAQVKITISMQPFRIHVK